jgi:hypothetical protein
MLNGAPEVAVEGALSWKCVALAAVTVTLADPLIEEVVVSVAVIVRTPAVRSVADKFTKPLSAAWNV